MATLVHDDLLDGADLRRGRPTVWAEYGEPAAKAAGDYLFARAFAARRHGRSRRAAVLADAALALARGEALQRRQAYRPGHDRRRVHRALLAEDGEALRGRVRPRRRRPKLGAFGLALGVAFQIADDILDCTGEFDTTGKAPGVDLRDGRRRCP